MGILIFLLVFNYTLSILFLPLLFIRYFQSEACTLRDKMIISLGISIILANITTLGRYYSYYLEDVFFNYYILENYAADVPYALNFLLTLYLCFALSRTAVDTAATRKKCTSETLHFILFLLFGWILIPLSIDRFSRFFKTYVYPAEYLTGITVVLYAICLFFYICCDVKYNDSSNFTTYKRVLIMIGAVYVPKSAYAMIQRFGWHLLSWIVQNGLMTIFEYIIFPLEGLLIYVVLSIRRKEESVDLETPLQEL